MNEKIKEEPTFCCCPLSKSVVIFALIHTFTSLTALFLSLFEMKADEIRIQDHLPFSAAFFGVISAFCILRATKVYNYRSYYRSAIWLVVFQIAVAASSMLAYAYSAFTSCDKDQSLKDKFSAICECVYVFILTIMALVYFQTGRFLEHERKAKARPTPFFWTNYFLICRIIIIDLQSRVYFYSSRSKIAPSFELP